MRFLKGGSRFDKTKDRDIIGHTVMTGLPNYTQLSLSCWPQVEFGSCTEANNPTITKRISTM